MIFSKKELFNVSNLLSLLRLLLAIPFIILFAYWNTPGISQVIILLVIFATITDILDGYLARKLNQITEFGKIIDPLADKIVMATVLIGILSNNLLPLYYFILVILRDLLILFGGIYIAKKTGFVLPSNIVGKITVLIIGFVILLTLLGLDFNSLIFKVIYYLSIIMIFLSLIVYLIRGINFYRAGK